MDRLSGERLSRIRAAVDHWDSAGETGTYEADYLDYGRIDLAILRDVRGLLAEVAALQGELERLQRYVKALEKPPRGIDWGMYAVGNENDRS